MRTGKRATGSCEGLISRFTIVSGGHAVYGVSGRARLRLTLAGPVFPLFSRSVSDFLLSPSSLTL